MKYEIEDVSDAIKKGAINGLDWDVKLPKNIKKFCHRSLNHPIIYDRFKKKAFCFHCGEYFSYTSNLFPDASQGRTVYRMLPFRADDRITCPICGKEAKAVPHTRGVWVGETILVANDIDGEIYLNHLYVRYRVEASKTLEGMKNITARIFLCQTSKVGRTRQACYVNYYYSGMRLRSQPGVTELKCAKTHPSVDEVIENSFLGKAVGKDCLPKNNALYKEKITLIDTDWIVRKLCLYAKRPQVEYLEKSGLCVEDKLMYGHPTYIRFNWKKRDLPGVLGITAQDIDKLRQWKMWDIESIAFYKYYKKKNPNRKLKKQELLSAITFYGELNECRRICGQGQDPVKLASYLEKQYTENKPCCHMGAFGYTRNEVKRTYIDYMEMANELEYPTTDYYLYPKDLKAMHDKLADEQREKAEKEKRKEREKELKIYKKHLTKLQKLAWEDGEYLIRPLVDYNEFYKEGKNNVNCVASYWNRVYKGETGIFVVRLKKDPDKEFLTVEMKNKTLVQCRGRGNSQPPEEAKDFVDRWMREIVNKKAASKAA